MIIKRVLPLLTVLCAGLGLPTDPVPEEEAKYKGYKVLAVTPSTAAELTWLVDFKVNTTLNCSLDWWNEPSLPTVPVSFSVNPDCLHLVTEELEGQGLNFNITIPDLEDLITEERYYRAISNLYRDPYDWSEDIYHNLTEINDRIEWLVDTYSEVLSTKNLATTYQGRNIDVVIARQPGATNKPVIWIDCGIHAREWVSPPACLHAINQLAINQNSVDPEENLLELFDFYILPVANPDGYEYSWTSDRMWRKNRRPVGDQNSGWDRCDFGVDPNRNFPVAFYAGYGSSSNPCDDSYKGTKPFSEAESQAVMNGINIMQSKYGKKNIAAFVSIHAYSQLWMSPYGYKKSHSKDHADQMRVMKMSVEALSQVYGREFTYGPISEVIYIAAGSSVDWAYEEAGIKYSFGLELRDTARSGTGFLLPQDQIVPTAIETWAGLAAMAKAISKEYNAVGGVEIA